MGLHMGVCNILKIMLNTMFKKPGTPLFKDFNSFLSFYGTSSNEKGTLNWLNKQRCINIKEKEFLNEIKQKLQFLNLNSVNMNVIIKNIDIFVTFLEFKKMNIVRILNR